MISKHFSNTSIEKLQSSIRGAFLSYSSFKALFSKIPLISDFTYKGDIYQHDRITEMESVLAGHLEDREDKDEIIGVAAVQVGYLHPVIYLEYNVDSSKQPQPLNIILTDPEITPADSTNPELFIKLIKCPNSPTPYHIGLFNRNILIKSSNRKSFTINVDTPLFGKRGELSAAIQRIGWANQGYVPGDQGEVPMNYYKICELLEGNSGFRDHFKCFIHVDEIEYIINKLKVIRLTDTNREETKIFKLNLISLMASGGGAPWLKVPAINLFENGNKLFLN